MSTNPSGDRERGEWRSKHVGPWMVDYKHPSGWRIAGDLFLVVAIVYLSVRLFIPAIARLF